MADRTEEQMMDEIVYAAACAYRHYGPSLSQDGLILLRKLLSEIKPCTDSTYRCDFNEADKYIDFHSRIIWPVNWDVLDYTETVAESKSIN